MTQTEFIQQLAEVLSEDASQMTLDTPLNSLAGWDSMGQVATLAMFDSALGVQVPAGALRGCKTIQDLLRLAADKLRP